MFNQCFDNCIIWSQRSFPPIFVSRLCCVHWWLIYFSVENLLWATSCCGALGHYVSSALYRPVRRRGQEVANHCAPQQARTGGRIFYALVSRYILIIFWTFFLACASATVCGFFRIIRFSDSLGSIKISSSSKSNLSNQFLRSVFLIYFASEKSPQPPCWAPGGRKKNSIIPVVFFLSVPITGGSRYPLLPFSGAPWVI